MGFAGALSQFRQANKQSGTHDSAPSIGVVFGMRPVAVFVLSDVRSGSTLLDQCLGAHPKIASLGEVHWLRAYVTEDRSLYDPDHPLVCSCGMRVSDCPFWTSVEDRVGRPLETLELRSAMRPARSARRSELGLKRASRRLVGAFPAVFRIKGVRERLGSEALARDLAALFDAVSATTGSEYCVDSSKSAIRFRMLHDFEPSRVRAIVLARDYRAVVHSKMKRGQSLHMAALGWKRKMLEIESMTRGLPPGIVHRLKYEDFCENPRRELQHLCSFLGVDFSESMLERPRTDVHHIGGSPSKFDALLTTIKMDRSHEDRFDEAELGRLGRLVGAIAGKWGY